MTDYNDSINLEQGTPFSWELPKDLNFSTATDHDDNAAFNKHLADNAAAIYGLPPELLSNAAAAESTKSFTNQWMALWRENARIAQGHLQVACKNVLLRQTKEVLTKVIHRNGGSMRKRRLRQYFARIKTTVVVKEQLLQNVYPTHIGPMVTHPDGTVSITVDFQKAQKPLPPFIRDEVAMRAYCGPDEVLNLVSFDLVNKAQ